MHIYLTGKVINKLLIIVIVPLLLYGCTYSVVFEDAQYLINTRQYDYKVIAVISNNTLGKELPTRSFWASGPYNTFDIKYGEMLKQVADIELPQMFRDYKFLTKYDANTIQNDTIVLHMFINEYKFEDYKATIVLKIYADGPNNKQIFNNVYTGEGDRQKAKIFWAGAFGMKSSIRQSSLDAYQHIFKALRVDLSSYLDKLNKS